MITIVSTTDPHDPSWLELRQALWPDDDAEEHRAHMMDCLALGDVYVVFLATDAEGTAQGFAEIAVRSDHVNGTDSSPVAFLEGVYVRPKARNHGVARALIAAGEAWGRARGCSEYASDALLEDTDSHRMHRALGFEETERVVYFRKDL